MTQHTGEAMNLGQRINPVNLLVGRAVSTLYPDFSVYLKTGNQKPHGEDWGQWLFEVEMDNKEVKMFASCGQFSDCIRSVCVFGREENANNIVFKGRVSEVN